MTARASSAKTAANSKRARPYQLRVLAGKGDGRDAAGAPIPVPPPFVRGAPVKPDGLSLDAEYVWDLVIAQWERLDMLKPLDAASLEVACETYSRWKEAVRWRHKKQLLSTNAQGVVPGPWIGIEERASREFRAWCAEYGLTPASESNVAGLKGAATPDNVNPFE